MSWNSSAGPSFFQLTLFLSVPPALGAVLFWSCLLVYGAIVVLNGAVFLAVVLDRSLHRPMFVFICGLSLNALCGSAAFFPRFLRDAASESRLIPRAACLAQMYLVHSYKGHEVTLLTVMAYDRYEAILRPLHYAGRMTAGRVRLLLAAALLYPACLFGFFFYLASRLRLCGNRIPRFYCTSWSVVRLACRDTGAVDAAGQVLALLAVFLPLLLVLYSYLRILQVCRRGSAAVRAKALQTCLPHVVTFLNFCGAVLCEVSLYRLPHVNAAAVMVLSLEFLVVPPVTNPLVYGLNLPQIRRVIFRRVGVRRLRPQT